jgi:hypothetical protein
MYTVLADATAAHSVLATLDEVDETRIGRALQTRSFERYHDCAMMQRLMIQAEPELIERVKRRAAKRGISAAQVWREGARHEVGEGEERIPPPLTCIGAFSSDRSDLSELASESIFEPRSWRS